MVRRLGKQKGFTLVEVIVVAVIVAALAAVAIGVYLNYVADARKSAVTNSAASLASWCGACANQTGAITGTAINVDIAAGTTLTCTYKDNAGADKTTTMTIPNGVKAQISALTGSGNATVTSLQDAAATKVIAY